MAGIVSLLYPVLNIKPWTRLSSLYLDSLMLYKKLTGAVGGGLSNPAAPDQVSPKQPCPLHACSPNKSFLARGLINSFDVSEQASSRRRKKKDEAEE